MNVCVCVCVRARVCVCILSIFFSCDNSKEVTHGEKCGRIITVSSRRIITRCSRCNNPADAPEIFMVCPAYFLTAQWSANNLFACFAVIIQTMMSSILKHFVVLRKSKQCAVVFALLFYLLFHANIIHRGGTKRSLLCINTTEHKLFIYICTILRCLFTFFAEEIPAHYSLGFS